MPRSPLLQDLPGLLTIVGTTTLLSHHDPFPGAQLCPRSSATSSIAAPRSLSRTAPPCSPQLHSFPFVPPSLVPIIRPFPAPLPAPSAAPSLLSGPAEGRIRSPGPCRLAPAPPCALLSAPLRSDSARSPRRGRRPGMKVLRHKIELLTGTGDPEARRGRGSRCRIPRAGAKLRGGSAPRCRSPRPCPRARGARGPRWAGEVGGLRGSCCGAAGASLRLTLGASSPAASFPGEPRCGFGGFVLRRRGGRGPTLCSVRFSSSPVPLVSPPTSVFYTLLLSSRGAVPAPRDATATLGSTRRAVGRPLWVPCLLDTAVKLFLLGIHTGMRSITVSSNAFPCHMLLLLQ